MTESAPTPQVIPPPPEFPVQWQDPADANLFWAQVQGYYPTPITPMGFALIHEPTVEVGNQSLAEMHVPLKQITRHINGYVYSALVVPPLDPTAPEMTQEQLLQMVDGLADRWHSTYLPEIEKNLNWWRSLDMESADLSMLVTYLNDSKPRLDRLERIHLDVVTELLVAIDLFQKTIADLFPNDDDSELDTEANTVDVHTLLAGFEAKGTQSSHALWQLSRHVLQEPTVHSIFTSAPASAVIEQLKMSESGRTFLDEFNSFLEVYGYQGNKNYISKPTLAEDPTLAIQSIQGYLHQLDRNLDAEAETIVAQREAALAAVREKLSAYPRPLVENFEFLLQAAQVASWLREEHAHQLDLPLNHSVRRLLLALGERLRDANLLEQVDDVFYVTPDEIEATVSAQPLPSLRELVTQRRAVEEHYSAMTPPAMFGTLPTEMPPPHPITAAIMQNMGDPSLASATPEQIKGIPASAGRVRGIARVLQSEAEAGRLSPQDILVTATTVPVWTPIFANIAGVVTATGGPLSHAAVVAREFAIPAVVGATGATMLIQDGQLIELDGATGVIHLDLEQ